MFTKPIDTINIKEEARSLIDKLPENFTWHDLMYAVYLRQTMKHEPLQVKEITRQFEPETFDQIQNLSPKGSRFGSDKELITTSDDFDEPLELLPSPLVDRLLEKAKELTDVSTELAEIIAIIDRERALDKREI